MSSASERLCAYAIEFPESKLPAAVHAAVRTFVLDSFGVALVGWRAPFADGLLRTCRTWGEGREARVFGTDLRLPAAHAALINAYLIHAQEFDAVHEAAVVHPFAVIQAALLAWCERRGGVDGRAFTAALAVAVEVAARLGMAARQGLRFFRPAQCGALGALAGIARLAGWSPAELQSGFGVLLGQLSGTMQAHREGSPALPVQIAVNARNVLAAYDLVAAGLRGPIQALEGEYGYLALFEGRYDLDAACADLGSRFAITEVAHKPYPSGRATHGGIDALQQLRAEHRFDAEQARALVLYAPPLVRQLVDRPARPSMPPNYAKLCFPWCAAAVLRRGTVGVEDFEPAALADPEVHRLAARVRVLPNESADPHALAPVRLDVELDDGRHLGHTIAVVLGHPSRPLSRTQHLDKFRGNWRLAGGAPATAEAFIVRIDRLEQEADVGTLTASMTGLAR